MTEQYTFTWKGQTRTGYSPSRAQEVIRTNQPAQASPDGIPIEELERAKREAQQQEVKPKEKAPQEEAPASSTASRSMQISDLTPDQKAEFDAVVADEAKTLPLMYDKINETKARIGDLQKVMDENQQMEQKFTIPGSEDEQKYNAKIAKYEEAFYESQDLERAVPSLQSEYDAMARAFVEKRLATADVTRSYTGPGTAEVAKSQEQTIAMSKGGEAAFNAAKANKLIPEDAIYTKIEGSDRRWGYITPQQQQEQINTLVTAGVLTTDDVKGLDTRTDISGKLQTAVDNYNAKAIAENKAVVEKNIDQLMAIPNLDGEVYGQMLANDYRRGVESGDMTTFDKRLAEYNSKVDTQIKLQETQVKTQQGQQAKDIAELRAIPNSGDYLASLYEKAVRTGDDADYANYKKAIDSYNAGVAVRVKEAEVANRDYDTFIRENTKLPDGSYIGNKDLAQTKKDSPQVYEVLTTKGFTAATKYIEDYNAKIAEPMAVTISKKGITAKDIWRALTPWVEENKETVLTYMKGYPGRVVASYKEILAGRKEIPQAELKTKYESQEQAKIGMKVAPLWARILFPVSTDVVYHKQSDTYSLVMGGEAPFVGSAGKAKEVLKVAEKVAAKAVAVKVAATQAAKVAEKSAVTVAAKATAKTLTEKAAMASKEAAWALEKKAIAQMEVKWATQRATVATKTIAANEVGMSEALFKDFLKARVANPKLTTETFKATQIAKSVKSKAEWDAITDAIKRGEIKSAKDARELPIYSTGRASRDRAFRARVTPTPEGFYKPKEFEVEAAKRYEAAVKKAGGLEKYYNLTTAQRLKLLEIPSITPIKAAVFPSLSPKYKGATQATTSIGEEQLARMTTAQREALYATGMQQVDVRSTPLQAPSKITVRQISPVPSKVPQPGKVPSISPFKAPSPAPAPAPRPSISPSISPAKMPSPAPGISPAPAPAPSPAPNKVPAPAPSPSPAPSPQPLPTKSPIPAKTPTPTKTPTKPRIPEKTPAKPRTPRLPPFRGMSDEEKREAIKGAGGAFTWQQGKLNNKPVFHVVVNPFGPKDKTAVLGKAPAGAKQVSGKGQSKATITLTRGEAPKSPRKFEGGAVDPIVSPVSKKRVRIDFVYDRSTQRKPAGLKSKRFGRIFKTRVGRGTLLSRKPLGRKRR